MSYLDKVTVGETTYDLRDTGALPIGSVGESLNLYDIDSVEWEDGTISNEDGTNASSNAYKRTVGYIPVDPAIRPLYFCRQNSGYYLFYRAYDSNGRYISGGPIFSNGTTTSTSTFLPAGTARLRMVVSKNYATDPLGIYYTPVSGVVNYGVSWRTLGALPYDAIVDKIETNAGSSANAYAIGDYFMMGGKLYRAVKAIAAGDSLLSGTGAAQNCAVTTVIAELRAAITALGGTV